MENKQISGVLANSIRQATMWLNKEFTDHTGQSMPYAFVGNKASLREAEQQMRDRAGNPVEGQYMVGNTKKLTYPFTLYNIAEISLDANRPMGLKHNRAFEGFTTKKIPEAGIRFIEDLRPASVGLALNFRTDSIDSLLVLAHILLMAAPKVGFTMLINEEFTVHTSLSIDPTVAIPETNAESPGEAFQYEAVLVLNTWLGYSGTGPLIKQISFNQEINGKNAEFYTGSAESDLRFSYTYLDFYDKTSRMFRGDFTQ